MNKNKVFICNFTERGVTKGIFMEKLMQYIWQHQLIDTLHLVTTDGRRVQVIDAGRLNSNAGPDFFNAKVRIDGELWVGNVEIHYRASDWRRHNHHKDKAYDSVILHVVEVDDMMITRSNGEVIPQLVMRAAPTLRGDYNKLVDNAPQLSCGERIPSLNPFLITDWLNSLALERLQSKSERIESWLSLYRGNWEEVCYVTLSRNMGFGINSDAFERLARSLPLSFLLKHADSLMQIEAFLLGQAGLLAEKRSDDDYYTRLAAEYAFLQNKFGLTPLNTEAWKFFRLRPQNFPHRRLAMLAQYIHGGFSLMARLCDATTIDEMRALFQVQLTGYWDTHYTFDATSPASTSVLGKPAIDIILINTVAPLLYAYGTYTGDDRYIDRAQWVWESLRPEQNSITRHFAAVGIEAESALDSQAIIQLHNEYCQKKKCLYCRIGHKLLAQSAIREE